MPDKDDQMPCPIATAMVFPALDRLGRDVSAAHNQLRDHASRIDAMTLAHDDARRRIEILERTAQEQRIDTQRNAGALHEMRADIAEICGKVDGISSHVNSLFNAFERHGLEMKEVFLEQTRRHQRSLRVGMTIASSVAALVAVLAALHGAVTGVNVIDAIKGVLQR